MTIAKELLINDQIKIKEENDCIHNNPTGECCDKLFVNAIEFAYKQKNSE